MEQLPTWTDLKLFMKSSWKKIFSITLLLLLIYVAALSYTVVSQQKIPNEEISSGEVTLKGITSEEHQALKEDEVSFSFYVENADDTAFMNYNLLKTVLLSPSVLPTLKEGLDLNYDVPDFYIINISRDNTNAMYINIGTGSLDENLLLANRIYEMLENNELSFFEHKNVYLLTKPRKIPLEEQIDNTETSDIKPSSVNYIILGLMGIFLSFIGGIVLTIISSFFKKEFVYTSLAHFRNVNKVINLTHLKDVKDPSEYLLQSILMSSAKGKKLVLTKSRIQELQEELLSQNIIVTSSLLEELVKEGIQEVIIIIEKNITEKNWYYNQRILLENYNIPIKVILL